MKYVSIDIETTGLGHGCEMIEFAAVLEDSAQAADRPIASLPYINLFIQPQRHDNSSWWEPEAARMHAESGLTKAWADALKSGAAVTERQLAQKLRAWLRDNGAATFTVNGLSESKIIVAGKNFSGFDARFLPEEIKQMFHHRVIDPGSACINWNADSPPSLKDLAPLAPHEALADARAVIQALRSTY